MVIKKLIVHQLKGRYVQLLTKEDIMQVTKNILKFNNMLIQIPETMKGVWDKSENRWGYRKVK